MTETPTESEGGDKFGSDPSPLGEVRWGKENQ